MVAGPLQGLRSHEEGMEAVHRGVVPELHGQGGLMLHLGTHTERRFDPSL